MKDESKSVERELESFFNETPPETPPEFNKAFDLGAQAAEKRREIDEWEATGASTPIELKTRTDELKRLNTELQDILKRIHATSDAEQAGQQPTRTKPASSITEAVYYVANELSRNGNTELTKKGNLTGFLKYLKECITERNPNFSDYVAERIKEVKNISGDCQIIMQARTPTEKRNLLTEGKHKIFKKTRVSSVLSEWRESKS